jgi:predicted transcriptional regulator
MSWNSHGTPALLSARRQRKLRSIEVHFAPELQAKIDQLAAESGYPAEKLLEEAMAIYLAELAEAREKLDSRYDDLKSGKVKPISSDEIIAHLREKSAAARRARGS